MPGERILVVTTGETPQVVTETLWALARSDPPWLPDRIVLATTAAGARIYREGHAGRGLAPLLGAGGRLAALWRDIGCGQAEPNVEMLVPGHGPETLLDLRTAADAELFAEVLLERIAALTADKSSELHVSLAGGRKTMSVLTGQVLSLLGRPQDRLSHVLVSPASLEHRPDFWWPGDGSPMSAEAQVHLHEVPYVRARAWVDVDRILVGPPGERYRTAILRTNLALDEPVAIVDLVQSALVLGPVQVHLAPQEAAVMAMIAIAATRGETLGDASGWDASDRKHRAPTLAGDRERGTQLWAWLTAAAECRSLYRDVAFVSFAEFDRRVATLSQCVDFASQIGPPLSRLRGKLRQNVPPALAERLLLPRSMASRISPDRWRVRIPDDLAEHPACPPGARAYPQRQALADPEA